MPSVVKALYHVLLPYDPPQWALSGRIWISIFMVALVPLCFLRSLHSLRHTSYTALIAVGMLRGVSVPKGRLADENVRSVPRYYHRCLLHFTT